MKSVNTQGLQNFINKVNRLKIEKNTNDILAETLAQHGCDIAKEIYGDKKVEVTVQKVDDGKRKIIARGKGLTFDEFGTGLVGQGTYPGELPDNTFTFESPKGTPQQTKGWVYYYPNPKTKIMGGWFAGKVFHRGQIAKAQMFNTSLRLKEDAAQISIDTIKEKL